MTTDPLDPEDRDWVDTYVDAPAGIGVIHVFGVHQGIDARHDILDRWLDQVLNTAAPDQVGRVMGEYRDLRSAIPGPSRADA